MFSSDIIGKGLAPMTQGNLVHELRLRRKHTKETISVYNNLKRELLFYRTSKSKTRVEYTAALLYFVTTLISFLHDNRHRVQHISSILC